MPRDPKSKNCLHRTQHQPLSRRLCDGYFDCIDRTDESGCSETFGRTGPKDHDASLCESDPTFVSCEDKCYQLEEVCANPKDLECPGLKWENLCQNSTFWTGRPCRGNILIKNGTAGHVLQSLSFSFLKQGTRGLSFHFSSVCAIVSKVPKTSQNQIAIFSLFLVLFCLNLSTAVLFPLTWGRADRPKKNQGWGLSGVLPWLHGAFILY